MSKAERTKKYIVEQVAPIFNRKGYAATSMKDLTDITGLTKGAIYGNFQNKDEVAMQAFAFNTGFINEQLRDNLLSARGSREKLYAYPQTFRKIHRQVLAAGGCPILNTAVDSNEVNVLLQKAVQKVIEKWRKTIVAIINEGIDQGELHPGIDARKTAEILICLVEGGYAMSKATGEYSYIESGLDQVEKVIDSL